MTKRHTQTPKATAQPTETAQPVRSRREFMRLLAAGSAAMLTTPAVAAEKPRGAKPAAPDSTRMRRARTEPGAHPMLPEELEKQKKSLADSLKVIRDFTLPPGNAPAFVFRPLAATRRRKSS